MLVTGKIPVQVVCLLIFSAFFSLGRPSGEEERREKRVFVSSTVVAAAASSQCLWPLEYQHPAAPASAPAPPLFTHFLFSVVLKKKKKRLLQFWREERKKS